MCLNRLNAPASSALFVDDRVVNLEAAARLGMKTLHYTGDKDTDVLREKLGSVGSPRRTRTHERGREL